MHPVIFTPLPVVVFVARQVLMRLERSLHIANKKLRLPSRPPFYIICRTILKSNRLFSKIPVVFMPVFYLIFMVTLSALGKM